MPGTTTFDIDGGHLGQALPPLDTARTGKLRDDVARVTQDLAHALETLIRRAPDQWHLLQPNWPSDHEALAAAGFPSAPTGSTVAVTDVTTTGAQEARAVVPGTT